MTIADSNESSSESERNISNMETNSRNENEKEEQSSAVHFNRKKRLMQWATTMAGDDENKDEAVEQQPFSSNMPTKSFMSSSKLSTSSLDESAVQQRLTQ